MREAIGQIIRCLRPPLRLILLASLGMPAHLFAAQSVNPPAPPQEPSGTHHERGVATLEADHQRQVGKVFYADGHVEIDYENLRLRADHVEYNEETKTVVARGNIQLDHLEQHIEADEATYDLRAGRGDFRRVRGIMALQRRPIPALLVSPNPIYFEAADARRTGDYTYVLHKAWVTVCRPDRPTWKFYARNVTVRLEKSVHLENANFRLFSIPVVYLPFASLPASRRRQSGFMIPDAGNSSRKGYFLGDSLYWAPVDWMDTTLGATYLSKRGWSQNGELRMRPWENTKLDASYFGVIDHGLGAPGQPPLRQGGHEVHFGFDSELMQGWRAVADLNQLSSLTFRLAFAETFSRAVNSEVSNSAFATNNFSGFSLNVAAQSYKNFFSSSPETSVSLRTAPEVRLSSIEQAPFKHLPLYFSFDTFAGAVHRQETATGFETPDFVHRNEFAPSVTLPLHFGPWFGATSNFTLRSTHYGSQLNNGAVLNQPLDRTTEEFTLDLRPPSFARTFARPGANWQHTIEPQVVYRYVTGVDDFDRFIRFDQDETLTDTNELEYGFRQRLFRRAEGEDTHELASWRLVQKYFFDDSFGGALIRGQRNVFQSTNSLTPFAFADSVRRFSPVVSDLRVTPGGRYDAQLRIDFDPVKGRMTAIGTLLKLRPYRESFLTLAHFSTNNLPPAVPPPNFRLRSNQVRALMGYGDLTRPGWNAALGFSYDVTQRVFQNQLVQLSYNGSCCGIGVEYRRLSLGSVRAENQYRVVLMIANLGSAGNLRRQERIF